MDTTPDTQSMRSPTKWWDGPWPWLILLVNYGIPWLWVPPTERQLLLSALALTGFVLIYWRSFYQGSTALVVSIVMMVSIGIALIPVGGAWSVLAIYPAIQAARLRPQRWAVWAIPLCVAAFVIAGIVSAQPVHDLIGRTLTLIALKADLLERLAVRDGRAAAKEAHSIGEQARAGFAEIRAALDGHAGGSLAGEIAASVAALEAAGVRANAHSDAAAMPPDAGAILAMTLREAVTNVIRHAEADRCTIELKRDAGQMTLSVGDNGAGTAIVEGNGLTGMRLRLAAAGGTLNLRTGAGTMLVASVPI